MPVLSFIHVVRMRELQLFVCVSVFRHGYRGLPAIDLSESLKA